MIETETDDDSAENENDSDKEEINQLKNENAVHLLLTNARSLRPKTESLKDGFSSLGLNVACVTETWYKGGRDLSDHLTEIEGSSGIKIIHKSRDGRTGKAGGGVTIAFDVGSCNLKARSLKAIKKEYAVLCVVGVIGKIARKVAMFSIYIPPAMRAADLEDLKEALATEIGTIMKTHKDPIVMIAGDFNHRDIQGALNEVGDFAFLATGPTRGNNTIDLVLTNCPEHHRDTRTLPPLDSQNGSASDHKCVYTEVVFPPVKGYQWVTQFRRTRDDSREEAFARELEAWDWTAMTGSSNVDDMARILEEAVGTLTDKHFPLQRVRKRSSESPWITKRIRKLWRRKLRLYKKRGKSQAWWDTDRKLQERIDEAKMGFVEQLLEEGNSRRSFYAATRKLSSCTSSPQWSVRDLFPGSDPSVVCSEVLSFYGTIACAPAEAMPDIGRTDGGLGHFSLERTAELLEGAKKTESHVEGDPLPHMVRRFLKAFAVPLSAVFNAVSNQGRWPARWKTEHLTIIPKVPNPGSLAECRIISCTSIYSKVLEGGVLKKLRGELIPDPGQYGGQPKCGAEHMLVDIWEKVMGALEGGECAAVLLGVDYEKAFNRMEHGICALSSWRGWVRRHRAS